MDERGPGPIESFIQSVCTILVEVGLRLVPTAVLFGAIRAGSGAIERVGGKETDFYICLLVMTLTVNSLGRDGSDSS